MQRARVNITEDGTPVIVSKVRVSYEPSGAEARMRRYVKFECRRAHAHTHTHTLTHTPLSFSSSFSSLSLPLLLCRFVIFGRAKSAKISADGPRRVVLEKAEVGKALSPSTLTLSWPSMPPLSDITVSRDYVISL